MKFWWTSDTHFYHSNIIKYCNRPYKNVEEMNAALIKNWNDRVSCEDTIFHLGDFSFGNEAKAQEILLKLNGHKILIVGNHDKQHLEIQGWDRIYRTFEKKIDNTYVVMCHYAMKVWNLSHHGSIQLYGHSHGTLAGNSQQLDVGVDCWNYAPVSLDEIKARLATLQPYKQADKHDEHTN